MITDAIILCGGFGKRLKPITDFFPKPLIPVNGKPLIEYQIERYKKFGVTNIILACGYKWEQLKDKYGDEYTYSVEKEPLDTGGAIKQALKFVKGEEFFVSNCDEIHDIDLNEITKIGSNAICLSRFNCRFGIVEVNEDGTVKEFKQKPLLPYWANMGVYLLNKSIPLPDKGAIETETFSKIKLKAYKHKGVWLTVNSPKELEIAEKFLKNNKLI